MKAKKPNSLETFRVMSDVLPISKKAKQEHPEVDFDIDWSGYKVAQYTIDKEGYFCQEKWKLNAKSKKLEIVALKRVNITQKIIVNTDIVGRPARFVISIDKGKVMSIERAKIV